jgi:hypothetical protein
MLIDRSCQMLPWPYRQVCCPSDGRLHITKHCHCRDSMFQFHLHSSNRLSRSDSDDLEFMVDSFHLSYAEVAAEDRPAVSV